MLVLRSLGRLPLGAWDFPADGAKIWMIEALSVFLVHGPRGTTPNLTPRGELSFALKHESAYGSFSKLQAGGLNKPEQARQAD